MVHHNTVPNSVTYIHLHTPTHRNTFHSGHPPPALFAGEEGLSLQPNFQKGGGGLTGPQFLEEGCWERGSGFFMGGGGVQFSHKNKLKSEISNDK